MFTISNSNKITKHSSTTGAESMEVSNGNQPVEVQPTAENLQSQGTQFSCKYQVNFYHCYK